MVPAERSPAGGDSGVRRRSSWPSRFRRPIRRLDSPSRAGPGVRDAGAHGARLLLTGPLRTALTSDAATDRGRRTADRPEAPSACRGPSRGADDGILRRRPTASTPRGTSRGGDAKAMSIQPGSSGWTRACQLDDTAARRAADGTWTRRAPSATAIRSAVTGGPAARLNAPGARASSTFARASATSSACTIGMTSAGRGAAPARGPEHRWARWPAARSAAGRCRRRAGRRCGTDPGDSHAGGVDLELVEKTLGGRLVPAVHRGRHAVRRPGLVDGCVVALGGVGTHRRHVHEVRDPRGGHGVDDAPRAADAELSQVGLPVGGLEAPREVHDRVGPPESRR